MIDAKDKSAIYKRVAEKFEKRLKTAVMQALDKGFLAWSRDTDSRARYEAYLIDRATGAILTLPEEIPYLLYMAKDVAEARVLMQSPFWARLQTAPGYVIEYFIRDFVRLHKRFTAEEAEP